MNENRRPLLVDVRQKEQVQELLPRPQIFSSHEAGWQNIVLEHHCQSAAEIPEVFFKQHILVVHLNRGVCQKKMGNLTRIENSQAGDVSLIPADVNFSCVDRKSTEYIVLCIEPEYLIKSNQDFIKGNGVELIPTFAHSDPFIYGTALTLKQELETDYNGCRLYAETLLDGLNIHLLRKYARVSPEIENYEDGLSTFQLRLVLNFISDRISSEISLIEMANYINLSKYHFSRLFKQSMGLTPLQYVRQQRINKAKQLLKDTSLPIADIARSCGFTHQSHFGRVFKQSTGVTPKRYREML